MNMSEDTTVDWRPNNAEESKQTKDFFGSFISEQEAPQPPTPRHTKILNKKYTFMLKEFDETMDLSTALDMNKD